MPERIPFIFSPGGFAIGRPLAVRRLIWDMMALVPQKVSQTPHERQRIRQQQAKPKLAELKAWMDQTLAATSTKSGLARAILYSARRWPALTRYADDGRIEIDNSAAERGLRCVALGRNNYLFADSDAGGEHAAAMYSLIGTAKLNGLDPQAYLRHALERIGDHPVNRIDDAASLERRRAAGTANRQAALGCLVLSAASMRCRAYAYCSSRQLLCTATTPTWRRSWAALLFGHVETDDEIIDRLELLRDSQGRSPGFEAFVPLVYPPGTTKLVAWLASPERGLQVLALSRLVLDNILHIKADWPTLQIETAAVALTFGADDLDGDSTPCAATAGSDRSAWKRLQLDEGTLRRPLIRNGEHLSMTVQVLLVNNASAEPFRRLNPHFPARVDEAPPTVAWRMAAAGSVDIALLPVVKLKAVQEVMEPIGDFGVACTGPVGSVLLLSRRPLAELMRHSDAVDLSAESETSRLLLQLLWKQECGSNLRPARESTEAQARLVIGDTALRQRKDDRRWPYTVDLCDWWFRSTGLPFVFARWTVRRCISADLKREAEAWLDCCASRADKSEAQASMAQCTFEAGLFETFDEALEYYKALTPRIGQTEQQGESTFLSRVGLHYARQVGGGFR